MGRSSFIENGIHRYFEVDHYQLPEKIQTTDQSRPRIRESTPRIPAASVAYASKISIAALKSIRTITPQRLCDAGESESVSPSSDELLSGCSVCEVTELLTIR